MIALAAALWVSLAAAETPPGRDAFFKDQVLEAAALDPVPTTAEDPRWSQVASKAFHVSAQRTVRLNDQTANAKLHRPGVGEVTVRAAYGKTELAVLLEWTDATENRMRDDENTFGDAAAIEFPARLGPAERLPYVGMGDLRSPVYLYLQRARQGEPQTQAFVAAGFGSLTRLDKSPASYALWRGPKGTWRALFRRPLVMPGHSLEQGLLPFACAVWDGDRDERGGNKQLSAWHFLRLGRYPVDPGYLAAQAWGYGPGELGDPARGKGLVEAVCVTCHWMPGKHLAMANFAPDLSDIGVNSTLPYLRDSVLEPSQVVVHHLQLNGHYVKNGPPDSNGAYPNLEQMAWYTVKEDGSEVSKMPAFAFPPSQIADIVAFLRTLDGWSTP